jgi:hypothetical protein
MSGHSMRFQFKENKKTNKYFNKEFSAQNIFPGWSLVFCQVTILRTNQNKHCFSSMTAFCIYECAYLAQLLSRGVSQTGPKTSAAIAAFL